MQNKIKKKKKRRVLSPLLHRLYFYFSTAKVEPYRRGAFVVQLYPSIPPSACYSLLKWLKEFLAVTTRIPWAHPSLQRWSVPYLHSTKPVQGGTLSKPIIALLFCIASSFFFFFFFIISLEWSCFGCVLLWFSWWEMRKNSSQDSHPLQRMEVMRGKWLWHCCCCPYATAKSGAGPPGRAVLSVLETWVRRPWATALGCVVFDHIAYASWN